MSPFIVIAGGPDGRTRHEGTDNLARPLLAAQHSRHAGRNSAVFGFDAFARVQGWLGIDGSIHRTAIPLNSSRPIRLPGSLIPGLARVHLRQKSSRCIAKRLQDIILSAESLGLVASVYGQHSGERKQNCPTQRRYGFVPIVRRSQ